MTKRFNMTELLSINELSSNLCRSGSVSCDAFTFAEVTSLCLMTLIRRKQSIQQLDYLLQVTRHLLQFGLFL
jgi:hypothetical protein